MSLSKKIVALSNRLTSRFREQVYSDYPTADFEEKHLANLQPIPTRIDMLDLLPKNAIVAEIGVNKGDFSNEILMHCTPEKFFLIDIWGSKRYHGGLYKKVKARFAKQIESGQMEIVRELSFDGIASFPDQFFDWVYLDTDHSYETTRRELELLRPKMKSGGIIAGHDYIIGNWNGGVRYGVIEAVREFCLTYDWELVYRTHELEIPPSFAIRKIQT